MSYKTFKTLAQQPNTLKGDALAQLVQNAAGSDEFAVLPFTGAVVDGDNLIIDQSSWTGRAHYESNTDVLTTKVRKFFFKLLGSGSLTLGDSSLNNTTAGIIRGVTITAHGLAVGQIIAVGSEAMRVVKVDDVNTVDVFRGYAGTTVATHASSAAVLQLANYTGINLFADVVVPVTALAIATAGPQIATAMTALDGFNPKDYGDFGSGIRTQKSLGFGFDWEYDSGNTRLIFHRPCRGNQSGSTTISLGGTITHAVIPSGLSGGVQMGEVFRTLESRVPTAGEVTAGLIDFCFPWPVKSVEVRVTTTSTHAPYAWDGAVSFSADFRRVTLDNSGSTHFAATNTVTVDVTG